MSSKNTQEKEVQVSGVMKGYSHKERLKAFKNISAEEKRRIEQKTALELNSTKEQKENSKGSFILDESSLPQQLDHALGSIEIKGKKRRYYGLRLYQHVKKHKQGEEYTKKELVPCILTEDGEIYSEYEKPDETNFVFKSVTGLKDNRISLQQVRKFTKGKQQEVTFAEVYDSFKTQYEKHLVFECKEWYELNALWDMATYFQDLFDKFLIIKHEGGSGTAKSKGMRVSTQQSFNGMSFLCPTPPNFFRYRSNNKAMLCIEEAERLFDDSKRKQAGDSDLVEYLNGSYEKGNTVPRQNENKLNVTEEFDPAGFTRIGAIKPLKGALAKRSITLTMIKAKPNDKRGETEVSLNPKDPEFQAIRDKAYILGLTKYRELQKAISNLKNVYGLHNRQWGISKPLLAIASLVSSDLEKRIGHFLNSLFNTRDIEDNEDSWNVGLAKLLLKRTVVNDELLFLSNAELVSMFREELNNNGEEYSAHKITSKGIHKLLKELSLAHFKGRDSSGSQRGLSVSFFSLAEILLRNEKLNIQETLNIVSEVSVRQITDEKISKWYSDTFSDTLENASYSSEISDTLTDTTVFRGVKRNKNLDFLIKNNQDLLEFLREQDKAVSFEEILQHCDKSFKPEVLEAMLKSYESKGDVFSPKPDYWGVV